MFKRKQKFCKIVAGWDVHYPYHDHSCLNVLTKFIQHCQPDVFIFGGDQLDMDMISTYNKKKPKLLEGKRLKLHYQGFNKDILQWFNSVLPDSCKKYFFIGNHEYRVQWLIEENPQHEGFIEINKDNLPQLEDWEIIPFNECLQLGEMLFIHGLYHNKYHAAKTLNVYDSNVFYGHTHSSQYHSKTTPVSNNPKMAQCIGCLCKKNPYWLRNRPNSWVHQFLHVDMFNDGTFSPHVETIVNGRCCIDGCVFDGGR